MKHLFAVLAASTALSGGAISAALADPDFTASLAAGPGQLDIESMGAGATFDAYSVQGLFSGAYNFTPELGAQGDVLIRFGSIEEGGDNLDTTSIDATLHGFYRDPDKFLLGGFVQLGQDDVEYDGIDGPTIDRSYVGVEGQAFFDQFTVYGQLGAQRQSIEGEDIDGWFITGEVRYFLTPDFKIEGHAGRSEIDLDGSGFDLQLETVNVGVGAEYKFADLPFSVFGKYDYATTGFNLSDDVSFDTHRLLVGVKFNLGEDSLQDRDRNGASLKPVDFGSNTNILTSGFAYMPSSLPPPP